MCAEFASINENELGSDDLRDVIDRLNYLKFDNTRWLELGHTMGLSYSTLKEIEQNYRGDCKRCHIEALSKWLNKTDDVSEVGEPTWNSLSDALRRLKEYAIADGLTKPNEHKRLSGCSRASTLSSDIESVRSLVIELGNNQKELEKRLEKVELDLGSSQKTDPNEDLEEVKPVKQKDDDESVVVKVIVQTYAQAAMNKGKNIISGVTKSISKGIDIINKSKRSNNNNNNNDTSQ